MWHNIYYSNGPIGEWSHKNGNEFYVDDVTIDVQIDSLHYLTGDLWAKYTHIHNRLAPFILNLFPYVIKHSQYHMYEYQNHSFAQFFTDR